METSTFTIITPAHPSDIFTAGQKLTIIDHDSYMRLIGLLTPEQADDLYMTATNGDFTAISGRLA
jgi:hypothetical protein